ncbi:MAG TPA: hypothetical protein VGP72_06455 [Planctomycetota bacterium]|jgi:hypothetical protein
MTKDRKDLTVKLVDQEIALNIGTAMDGKLAEDAKTLVDRAIKTARKLHPWHSDILLDIDWTEQEITKDTTRNGRRMIRIDYQDRPTMPLFVTITENK